MGKIFTKKYNELEECWKEFPINKENIIINYKQLEDKYDRISHLDGMIKEIPEFFNMDENELEKEMEEMEFYRDIIYSVKEKCDNLVNKVYTEGSEVKTSSFCGNSDDKKRSFKLPKLEQKRFDGDVKKWIGFWGQFRKIHEDDSIDEEDKFQYLIQATEVGTPARHLVESFPPSRKNYGQAITQLKARFGRDEFLIEVYVRELLNLVLNQAKSKASISLSLLYDNLETQLRALESLGVTSDKYAAMLYPLAESSLPEDTLKAWERHRVSNKDFLALQGSTTETSTSPDHLKLLLNFLRLEAESEERIKLAQSCFGEGSAAKSVKKVTTNGAKVTEKAHLPTAANMFSSTKGEVKYYCIFCDKNSHRSQDCFRAKKLSLTERRNIVYKKRCCLICLKPGHHQKNCKSFVRCLLCNKKHYIIMCPDLCEKENKEPIMSNVETINKSDTDIVENLFNLQAEKQETLLQTLIVKLVTPNGSRLVRALLDTGSQRSYIVSDLAQEMQLESIGKEKIIQGLFGGIECKPSVHALFQIDISDMNNKYNCNFTVLEQKSICNFVPKLDKSYYSILRKKGIVFNDTKETILKIELLLGADVLYRLYTGRIEKLNKDLIAVETYLGWAVMGKQLKQDNLSMLCSLTALSMSDLWELDVLGIRDSIEVQSKAEKEKEVLNKLYQTISRDNEGRYEINLPWVEGSTHF